MLGNLVDCPKISFFWSYSLPVSRYYKYKLTEEKFEEKKTTVSFHWWILKPYYNTINFYWDFLRRKLKPLQMI